MQKSEIECITTNLPRLLELTDCNICFLSNLLSQNVLTKMEVDQINTKVGRYEKAYLMYEILQTRSNNSCTKLRNALQCTGQTGALEILDNHEYPKFSAYKEVNVDRNKRIPWIDSSLTVYKGSFGQRSVVIKLFSREYNDSLLQASTEIDQLTRLDWHQNILRCFTAQFVTSGTRHDFGVVLDDKVNLKSYVKLNKCTVAEHSRRICAQIVRGAQFLRSSGVIHLNLDLQSVFVCANNPLKPVIKIGEFGVSRRLTNGMTQVDVPLKILKAKGAGAFFTPEVLHQDSDDLFPDISISLGYETDVFCIGVLLYYVLSEGCHPFGEKYEWVCRIRESKYKDEDEYLYRITSKEKEVLSEIFNRAPFERPLISIVADLFDSF